MVNNGYGDNHPDPNLPNASLRVPGHPAPTQIVTGRSGRNIRVSHRRTPSELTPLMQENLALQQQNELLQAQQHILLQRHFAATGGHPAQMMYSTGQPYIGGSPLNVSAGEMPYGAPPHLLVSSPAYGEPYSSGGHLRTNSGSNYSPGNLGHNRRHSLAVSEARKSAHEEQQRRADPAKHMSPGKPFSHSSSKSMVDTRSGDFRFPPSPETAGSRVVAPTGSAQGRTSPSPVRRQFNFSAQRYVPSNRQASSGGGHAHRRSNSRNAEYNNFRYPSGHSTDQGSVDFGASQNLTPQSFKPGHRSRGSFGSTSSISAYMDVNAGGQVSSGSTRKSLFVPYLTHSVIPQLVEEGLLVLGVLRVNRKNRSDAYVSTDSLDADIFICGSKDRNRALEGDLVAVELLDVGDVWDSKKEKEERKRRRDNGEDQKPEGAGSELRRRGSLKQRPMHKRNDDVEVEGQALILREEEAHSDEVRPLYAGHVVAIVERPSNQLFSGYLGLLRPSSQATLEKQEAERAGRGEPPLNETRPDRPKIVWFRPTDKCVPLMAIPTEQAPKDFVENHLSYSETIFVASVKRWPITSLHPFGTLVENLGSSQELDVKVDAILRDNNFANQDSLCAGEALSCIEIPSADPTSKSEAIALGFSDGFSEQAIQLEDLSNGNIKLTVHTLDATHLVEPGSTLDLELKARCVGLSTRERCVPLLPKELCAQFSFSPEKITKSLSFEFELHKTTFEILETPRIYTSELTPSKVVGISNLKSELPQFYERLYQIATKFKAERGATPSWLDFAINIRPIPVENLFVFDASLDLLMELLHKVNSVAAQRLLAELGPSSLVLRQAEPLITKLEQLSACLKGTGIDLELSSMKKISQSLASIQDPDKREVVLLQLYKLMPSPRYAVAGTLSPTSLGNFWLNLPAYTQVNFPLRSYGDLVGQRQIKLMLSGQSSEQDMTEQQLASLATELSFRNDCLRTVVEQFIHLKVCQSIRDSSDDSNTILCTGLVTSVHESAFDVLIPKFNLEKRVHGDQLPLVKAEYSSSQQHLELFWDSGREQVTQDRSRRSESSAPSLGELAAQCTELLSRLELSQDNSVQTVKVLDEVPVILKVEFGARVLPSITAKTLNPFFKYT